jgi:hypothetical protein
VSSQSRELIVSLRHTIGRNGEEDHKKIGIHSSEDKAQRAIERLKNMHGFKDPRGYFTIDRSILNFEYWATGFENGDED